ncbi:uncharacterized protein LOC105447088 [Strongylocentrotus purpuratus]|uniref:Monocarboxylate transporter n=1 Tax=Strongylocentrotus purpuratus TaxID=7668 RepID=A0A7M7PKP7_STRPU|nr:uncharacterized protein LOC105447088 [Strongylocentrotus purpuratus]
MAALPARSLSGSTVSRWSEARRRSGSRLSSCQRSPRCSSPWWLIVYCFFANGFTIGCYRSIVVFIPDIMVTFDSNSTLMGWLFSIDYLLVGILTPVAAYLTSKFGTRPVVMAAGTFAASGVLMLSRAKHIGLVLFGIGVVTASSKAVLYASTMLLTRRTFQKHYALANGINISGYSCFLFLFPPILEALRDVYGWRGACLILSGCMLNTVVMGLLMKSRQTIRNPATEDGQTCHGQAVDTPDKHQEGDRGTSTSLHMDSHVESQHHENANGSKMMQSAKSQTGLFQCHEASLTVEEEISVDTNDQRYLPDQENTSHDGVQFSHCLSANAVDESMIKDENNPMLPKTGNSEHRPLSISSPRHGLSGKGQTPLQETAALKHDEDSIIVVSGEGCGPLQRYHRYFISQNYHTFIIYTLSVFFLTTALSIFMIHITPSLKESGVGSQDIATCLSVFAASNLVGSFI